MDKQKLQNDICKVITSIGGRIKWKKELGLPARLYYYLSKKEPIINIEAFFLGERFAVIIDQQRSSRRMFNTSPYRIITSTNLDDFKRQFEAFKLEKLNSSNA